MNCHYHPDRPVARECRMCHELICTECVVLVGDDAICKSCVAEAFTLNERGKLQMDPKKLPQDDVKKKVALEAIKNKQEALGKDYKRGILTVLFSCLPGLGHYYLGMQKRGLNMMILFFLIIFLATLAPNGLDFATGVAIPIMWFYSQVDALKYRTLINNGVEVEDVPLFPQLERLKTATALGLLVALFGCVVLVNNLLSVFLINNWMLQSAIKDVLVAVVLVAVGIWLLKGKSLPFVKAKEESDEQNHA
ncbi:MAG: hypothetical protein ACXVDE_04250 [Tumebacillaceae bacterium]